jgi:2-desacetyl-2-hydroxyethyl bacteriochlorophyllide A dehydrogenase
MKSAVLYGRHDLRVEDRAIPSLGPAEVLIKVGYTGICGSDIHLFEGMQMPSSLLNPGPRIIGHEVVGTVAEVGADVTTCRPGDRVSCIPWEACGICHYCRRGIVNHCTNKRRISGAFAEFATAPQGTIFKIPDAMPMQHAALAEPLSCCVWAIDLAGLRSGETAVVIGAGTMGLLLQLLAQSSGAAQTVVSEPNPTRRALAARFGATTTVNPREQNLGDIVREMTDGLGADVAFEAVGHPATVQDALGVVRNAGTVVIVGVADPKVTLPFSPYDVYLRELTVRACFTRRLSFDRALNWLHQERFGQLITHVFPLANMAEAMEIARTGGGGKVLVAPNGEMA